MKGCRDIDGVEFIVINTANKPVDKKSVKEAQKILLSID
jgi:hypothetical protein